MSTVRPKGVSRRELGLSARQLALEAEYQAFAMQEVAPLAEQIDRTEEIPRPLVDRLASAGMLRGAAFDEPPDPIAHGLRHEALAYASASVEGLVNVHLMVTEALERWGTALQRRRWVPELATGARLAALAITEPEVGSDASSVRTRARAAGRGYVLDGRKKWITCGQIADVFLVLARCEEGPATFLVPRDAPGLRIEPIRGLLGCRGYMLAELHLDSCAVPADHLLGAVGAGFSHVATTALCAGRVNLAWACVGVGQACLDAALRHAGERRQFGHAIEDFELVQRILTRMIVRIDAAFLLCLRASHERASGGAAAASMEAAIAKYFASTTLTRVASDALQLHGALGCSAEVPLQRYFRDAKIMELIEGTTQILETMIARQASSRARVASALGACAGTGREQSASL
jgi:alkylation response protein AidB-like acyl-CoA dehydrogenase